VLSTGKPLTDFLNTNYSIKIKNIYHSKISIMESLKLSDQKREDLKTPLKV
jgi:hypothetical protein